MIQTSYYTNPIYHRGVETLGKLMPKKQTAAPKSRFRPYRAKIILTSNTELPSKPILPTPGGSNPNFSSASDPPAPTDITNTTLYRDLMRPRNIPQFQKRPLVVLHEDTTTVLTVLVFPQAGATSPNTNSVSNSLVPTPSSVPKSLHDCIALLNKSSECLRHLGLLNLLQKPSDETLAHTATQSPGQSPNDRTIVCPHLTNLVHPLNQTPCLDPPLLTLLPPLPISLPTTPAQAPDAHLVQQEVLCHRLDHKDRVAKVREETLRDRQKSCQCLMRISIPFTLEEGLAEEVRLMIGPRDVRLRPLMETGTSITDGSTRL